MHAGKEGELSWEMDEQLREASASPTNWPSWRSCSMGGIDDDVLRLMFVACHPVLSSEARAALTLRWWAACRRRNRARLPGAEATVAQRIVRAKRTLAEAKVPFEVPRGDERKPRLASVLQVIYLIYNEGYSASAGADWLRPNLCREALRLGRMLAELAPEEGEVHGLVALMEIQSSRERARTGPNGEPVLLLDQDRSRWDQLLIRRGLAALDRAASLGSLGPYALQAAIAACHARALTPDATDWARIAALYDALSQLLPSPIVELNRAVALGMAYGPAGRPGAGGPAAGRTGAAQLPPAAQRARRPAGQTGPHAEARAEFERAAGLTQQRARTRAAAGARSASSARSPACW
jgi:predicted RNA polymerase sigma factor